jgi:hypothetical protein
MNRLESVSIGTRTFRTAFGPRFIAVLLSFLVVGLATFGQSSRGAEKSAKMSSKAPAAPKPASTKSSAEEAEADVDVDEEVSALIVPQHLLGKAKDADRARYDQELRGILADGFNAKDAGLEAARKHFDAAHRVPGEDPRAAYAYAMALVAHKKSAMALEQFRSAAKLKAAPYLPALQGIAWMSVSRAEYEPAFAALRELAQRLEESQESWPTAADKEHSAEWFGSMIGFLVGPGKTASQGAAIDALATEVPRLLKAERRQAYDRGLKASAARYDELKALAARPAEELLAESRQTRDDLLADAATANSEVQAIEGELRELRKPHDKKLTELSRAMRTNATKIKMTEPKIEEAQARVEEFSKPKLHPTMKSGGFRRPAQLAARKENDGEKRIRESQLASAEKDVERLQGDVEAARQAITDARQEREQIRAEFRNSTADKRQALQAAQRKAAELSIRAREAEAGTLTPEKLKAQVKSLEAYVPLYPEVEKSRLLATLKPAAS